MSVTVTMLDGTSHLLPLQPRDTVASLKSRIQAQVGLPPERQKLTLASGTPLANDQSLLSSYGVRAGSQLYLLVTEPVTIQVFLRNEKGKQSTYDIRPAETVVDFKQKVQAREGVPADQQRLIHQGLEMTGGKLEDYHVRALSTIDMTLRLRGGRQLHRAH